MEILTFTVERKEHFKNWIKNRFLDENDVSSMTPEDLQAWGEAFFDMGAFLIAQVDARGTGR